MAQDMANAEPVVPVLVIETDRGIYTRIKEQLSQCGFVEGVHFVIFGGDMGVSDYVVPDRHQVLISSLFGKSLSSAGEFVRRMVQENFLLRTILLADIDYHKARENFFDDVIQSVNSDQLMRHVGHAVIEGRIRN